MFPLVLFQRREVMTTKRFFNPVLDSEKVSSTSSVNKEEVKSVSAFNITDPMVCPKCSSSTVESKLMSGESIRFCTNCRVSMALPE